MQLIHYITNIPAETWYHTGAFLLVGLGAQYTVQLVKVITKFKYGKTALRFLNGAFSTAYIAAGALLTGGASIGHIAISSAAVASLSATIYRIHNSVLYKSGQSMVESALDVPADTSTVVTKTPSASAVSASAFAGDPE